jgi:putative protease
VSAENGCYKGATMISADSHPSRRRLELMCAVGALPTLRTAVVSGADCVSFELAHSSVPDDALARRLSETEAAAGIRYARNLGVKVVLRLDTYPRFASFEHARRAVDCAAELGADAVELSDPGLMDYAAKTHPGLALHVGVRAGATTYEAVNFYRDHFRAKRAVISRTVGLAQLEELTAGTDVEIEICGFGAPCIMIGGHCALSSYVTGASVNTTGLCSPASAVRWEVVQDQLESRLNGALLSHGAVDSQVTSKPCKGCYEVIGQKYLALDVPGTLNAVDLIPVLERIGVVAVRIEAAGGAEDTAWATRVWHDAVRGSCDSEEARAALAKRSAAEHELSLGATSPQWR